MKTEKLLSYLKSLKVSHLVIAFFTLGALAFVLDQKPLENPSTPEQDPSSVDTYIPEGMTLIPIEIQNIESLKNILGSFGVVDLYIPSYDLKSPPKKIASGIKIMRAPLNPDVFAVLVLSQDASKIAQHPGAFFVTVLNPKTQKSNFEREKPSTSQVKIITEI